MRYISIIILLVLCLTLLLLTGFAVNTDIPETAIENIENQEDINQSSNNSQSSSAGPVTEPVIEEPAEATGTKNSQKWSGLTGFTNYYGRVADAADTWLANGFTETRDLRDYTDISNVAGSKAAVIAGNAKGLKSIWGVSSNSYNNPDNTITSTNWLDFRAAILDAAQWAQDNGVYEFQVGNEEELHVDGTTMTAAQIIINLKDVATDVKAIFTNGNISYSTPCGWADDWADAGKGDIDLLGINIYWGNDNWITTVPYVIAALGVDGVYITEFNLNVNDVADYDPGEAVQATGLTEMIDYLKGFGITRALFYTWHDYTGCYVGVVKTDETYRLLWNQALLNSGSVKFATVPTTITTISLPDTIALIP